MTKEEVHKIIPSLKAAAEMGSPFQIPTNYFEDFEDQITAQIALDKFPRTTGFEAPEGYFDSVEDVVLTKLKATAFYKDSASQEIPKNYFESIEDKVIQRLKIEDSTSEKKTKVISLRNWKKIMIPIAAAASIILLFTLGNKQNTEVSFDNLALAEIEYALENSFIDYDSESFLELFPEVEASLTNIELEISEEDNLEDYLYETDLSNLLFE